MLLFDPLLSSDIYRYVWDGRVQAAGINPYRYFPAHEALAFLRDGTIFPHINRADFAVTIYPPVAQFFFLIVTRIGESVTTMRLALLGCEAVTVTLIMLLLRRMNRPVTRVTAYLWHPLPLWEIANSGHVDALMVALMLLGLWIALTGHALRGAVLIAFAALVKPFAAPVLAGIWRPWDLKMPLVVIAAVALCYLPYLSVGWGVLGFLTKGYLTEEGISAGNDLWLLSLWRLVFGEHQGDVVAYAVLAALVLLFKGLSRGPQLSSHASRPALPTSTCCYSSLSCCCHPTIPGIFWSSRRLSPCVAPRQPGSFRSERSCCRNNSTGISTFREW